MFPPIALFSSLIILVGQIPGYSVSGGLIQSKNSGKPSSSADKDNKKNYDPVEDAVQRFYGRKPSSSADKHYNKNHNPVPDVQYILFEDNPFPVPREKYREIFFKARLQSYPHLPEETRELLETIARLCHTEQEVRSKKGIPCTDESLGKLMNVKRAMNDASGRSEFTQEAAKQPLNAMILDIADMLFERCSSELNDELEQIRLPAVDHLDRFRKFVKLPEDFFGNPREIPYTGLAVDDRYIDVNTELVHGDLEWLGAPQEIDVPRKHLLKKMIEKTCNQIDNDEAIRDIFRLGLEFVQATLEFYRGTGKLYYFRDAFGLYRICKVVAASLDNKNHS